MNRGRVTNPTSEIPGGRYLPEHFHVGQQVTLRGRKFLLTDADEFTHEFMEERPHLFPLSDLRRMEAQLRQHWRVHL